MKYREYKKEYIGESDSAVLVVLSQTYDGALEAAPLKFGQDHAYSAYIVDQNCDPPQLEGWNLEIIRIGAGWFRIYDDHEGIVVQKDFDNVLRIYRRGEMGCIIQAY